MPVSSTGSSRGNPAMGDIVRTVVVLGLIILAIWGFGRLFTSTPKTPTQPIDYATTVRNARGAADFTLLAPPTLPAGWKATSARFEPTSWHLGVLTKDGDYVGVEQLKVSEKRAVGQFAKGSTDAGTATVGGGVWSVHKGPNGYVTYVRRTGNVTTLVTGNAPQAVVEAYVASLSSS